MTFQWTLIASFLYLEIAIIALLLIPFISPDSWKYIFNTRISKLIIERSNLYFSIFIAVLVLFFLDAVQDMRKYTSEQSHIHVDAAVHAQLKLFRSQRNFYISGFALFLFFVVRRLLTLIFHQATLNENNEKLRKEAQISTELSQKLLREKQKRIASIQECAENLGNARQESNEKEIKELKERLSDLSSELEVTKTALKSFKNQVEAVSKEYDVLMTENMKLKMLLK